MSKRMQIGVTSWMTPCTTGYPATASHSIMDSEAINMLANLMMTLPSDEAREQFERFYLKYENMMFKAARQILDNQQDCEDVVQSSCEHLIDHFEKVASYDEGQTASYLVLLIRSRAKDLHKKRRRFTFEDIDQYADALPDTGCSAADSSLDSAFELLPERYKEVLTLYYYNELSVKELASLLQMSENATRKLLQRSRDALRSIMTLKGGGNE